QLAEILESLPARERPRQPGLPVRIGQRVGRPVRAEQVEVLAEPAQVSVGGPEQIGAVAGEESRFREGAEGPDGGGLAQARLLTPVLELEELDQELDVGKAAGAELQVAVALRLRDALRL